MVVLSSLTRRELTQFVFVGFNVHVQENQILQHLNGSAIQRHSNHIGIFSIFPFFQGIEMFSSCVYVSAVVMCVCVCAYRNVFLFMREVFSITASARSGNRWQQMTGDKVALSYLLLLSLFPQLSVSVPHPKYTLSAS